ncbi:unnamed protein product [Zymoseptoria tritici ST99CH_1A5]|uniref:ERCC1-like central domain-containing protein n=4 Tax=Zymoseptoria tritici TaxID=1047171 RepID=A0A1X7RHS6_ZYMT9|nr:unnamed protein product [Zymoseptoria tritici ST99CH_3D7]SMR43339.1 unnamed protein product [Zymoseptoria tritici ST99CH_1E4]SMR45500.1 unnamed protein product [Zymoseptoria tritici ST99CH_3D1]SMY20660.1 unnamed protein product [Zymoseptoria tritici ST99CH_1A5]
MADEIEDSGPMVSRTATSGPAPRQNNGQTASRPSNQPGFDRRTGPASATKTGVVQPTPQALPRRTGPAAIIVSPRQKGNPVLERIKSMPWEYGDIAADYVLGVTTCALFLSLKYHRLHPEYIYTRIKALQGKFALRIILCMVDIQNHEETLKELSKTSVINNVTVILCWSAAEGGRYLELFKTYENAAPTSIKQHQSTTYSDRLIDFVTTPRSINKTDAVSLVAQFGSIRAAVNARHEDVSVIAGFGEKKVQKWCDSVREPFRVQRAAKRGIDLEGLNLLSQPVSRAPTLSRDITREDSDTPDAGARPPVFKKSSSMATTTADADRRPQSRLAEATVPDDEFDDDEEALRELITKPAKPPQAASSKDTAEEPKKRKANEDPVSDGIMAALSKLRKS